MRRVTSGVGVIVSLGIAMTGCASTPPDTNTAAGYREVVMTHEELIAACLRSEGFDYIAALPSDVYVDEAVAAATESGADIEATLDTLVLPVDPNAELMGSLSESESAAFQLAYWGDDASTGCYNTTFEEAWGAAQPSMEELDANAARGADYAELIDADPRTIAAEQGFMDCMTADGYPFDSVEELNQYPSVLQEAAHRAIKARGGDEADPSNPEYATLEAATELYDKSWNVCYEAFEDEAYPIRLEIIDAYNAEQKTDR